MYSMKITFLGTGTSMGVPEIGCPCEVCRSSHPYDKRLRSAVLIETAGSAILIDAGPDIRQQLLRENTTHLDAVLLTHEHYDHIGGIDDLRPFTRQKPLPIFGMRRVLDTLRKNIPYVFSGEKYPGIPDLSLHEVEKESFAINELEIMPVEVLHYKLAILGFRIGRFAYLTDVKEIPEASFEKLQGLDILVLNALRKKPHISHQTIDEALRNIEKIAPRTTYLTHFNHDLGLHTVIEKELPADIFLAYDGLTVTV